MALWARRTALENIGIKYEDWKRYDRNNIDSLPEDIKTLLIDYLKKKIEQIKRRQQRARQLWKQYKPQLDELIEEIFKGREQTKDIFYSNIYLLTKELPDLIRTDAFSYIVHRLEKRGMWVHSSVKKRVGKAKSFKIEGSGKMGRMEKAVRIVSDRMLKAQEDQYEEEDIEEEDVEPKYQAVLFAPDGDWVTDFRGRTIDEVKDKLANRGSLWIFYPLEGIMRYTGSVTSPSEKVIEMAPPLEFLSGKTIREISDWLEEHQEDMVTFFSNL